MKVNCIIVEDEPLALERVANYISKIPYLNLIGCFENSIEALLFLKSNSVDLIFLDIQMDELSGIELLEALNTKIEVIITSAYNEYALKGFDLNVTDYLLKPFTFERFLQATERAKNSLAKIEKPANNFIFIKADYKLEKVFFDDILYVEGMRDYRRIHTKDKRLMTLQTFYDLEKAMPSNLICRVHKSYMVSLSRIDSVEKERIKIGDVTIPISETYKKRFFELINHAF